MIRLICFFIIDLFRSLVYPTIFETSRLFTNTLVISFLIVFSFWFRIVIIVLIKEILAPILIYLTFKKEKFLNTAKKIGTGGFVKITAIGVFWRLP